MDFESIGRRFDSCQVRYINILVKQKRDIVNLINTLCSSIVIIKPNELNRMKQTGSSIAEIGLSALDMIIAAATIIRKRKF